MEPHLIKIMIVDDDTFLLNMYSMKFTKNNFEVNTAQSGTEALKKLKDGFVADIVVLDIIMPGMDGIELLSQIKHQNLAPKATFVMLTNQGDSADIDRAKAVGIDGYIVKATTIPSEVVSTISAIHSEKNKK